MRKYSEPLMWTLALLALFFIDVYEEAPSFCLFKLAGFNRCFGCGIGHAIHHALHFNFRESFHEHMLGIPAAAAILYNIFNSYINQNKPAWTTKCI
jgi:hypothetical protein